MSRWVMAVGAAAALLVLSGCYEETTPTSYEPGVYKGASDPLLDKLESEELRNALDARFKRAATDR